MNKFDVNINEPFGEFLGVGNNKKKVAAQNSFEQELINNYPFVDDCAGQTDLFNRLQRDSASTLQQRNSSRGKTRTNLTGKLRAFDAYIPLAQSYMDLTCAPVPMPNVINPNPLPNSNPSPVGTGGDPTLNTALTGTGGNNTNNEYTLPKGQNLQNTDAGTIAAGSTLFSKRNLLIGGVVLAAVAGLVIYKLKK